MKTCPSCGYRGERRARNEDRNLGCPECGVELEIQEGEWISVDAVPPTMELYKHLISEMRSYLNTSFYTYEVENPTIPKKKIKETWKLFYTRITHAYPHVDREDIIGAFNYATTEIIDDLASENKLSISLVVYNIGRPGWISPMKGKIESIHKARDTKADVDYGWMESRDE